MPIVNDQNIRNVIKNAKAGEAYTKSFPTSKSQPSEASNIDKFSQGSQYEVGANASDSELVQLFEKSTTIRRANTAFTEKTDATSR